MELRNITICMALFVLAISHCSEAHSMHRRQAVDDITGGDYEDGVLGDEATDDEQNDETEQSVPRPEPVPAVIETAPHHYEVKAGEDVTMECKVTPENGTVVSWYKDDEPWFMRKISFHPEETRYAISKTGNDLVIKNAQYGDRGVFRCETPGHPVAINHTLLVLQKPTIIRTTVSSNGSVAVGASLTMTCVVEASPWPTVLWSVNKKDQNQRLTEKDAEFLIQGNVYGMYIKNVKKENAGQYYCYAFNDLGHHQAEIDVVVYGKPQVHVPRDVVNSDIEIEAVLQCAAHGETKPHIRWYKDSVLIEDSATKFVISTEGSHSNLTVSPKADGDFGTFTCEAENGYGTHNRSIELVQSPVVEDFNIEGPKISWTVHSHQPVENMEVLLKSTSGDAEWTTFNVPVPEVRQHKYDITYTLEDKQVQPGEYLAIVKVKNSKGWGGTNEPSVINIQDPQSLYIQTASVFRKNNAAHSIRPVNTVLSTILMYLLVRMLY